MSKPQFRIKYYDYDDSELYTIIQVASSEPRAILDAEARLKRSTRSFKIIDIEEINTPKYYMAEIRKILTAAKERDEPSWLRKRRKTTG